MTQFISITDKGGRIGRIQWRNTQRRRPVFPHGYWGRAWWDHYWPHPGPDLSRLARQAAEIADNAAQAFRFLQPTVHGAAESIRALGRAFEEAAKVPSRLLIIDDVFDVPKLSPEKEKALMSWWINTLRPGKSVPSAARPAPPDPIRINRPMPPARNNNDGPTS